MFEHMFYLKTECVALCGNQHGYNKKKTDNLENKTEVSITYRPSRCLQLC